MVGEITLLELIILFEFFFSFDFLVCSVLLVLSVLICFIGKLPLWVSPSLFLRSWRLWHSQVSLSKTNQPIWACIPMLDALPFISIFKDTIVDINSVNAFNDKINLFFFCCRSSRQPVSRRRLFSHYTIPCGLSV